MKSQEIVIRIVIEQPSATVSGMKEKRVKTKKSLPSTLYPALLALDVGGTLDISEPVKALSLSRKEVKYRIASAIHWYNKRDGTEKAYTLDYRNGETRAVRTK